MSALYARWAVKESKKANEINRFKILLDLKSEHFNEMNKQAQHANKWGKDDGFALACRESYADAEIKYRAVCKELDACHSSLLKN